MSDFDPLQEFIRQRPRYEAFCQKLFSLVETLLDGAGVLRAQTEHRTKEIDHFADKLRRIERDIESLSEPEVADLVGVRIILFYTEDVGSTVELIRSHRG